MIRFSYRLILPLAIISMALFTKWWYAVPIDARDTMYSGFPFPFAGEAWHTSGALQIFVAPLIADFIIYYLAWFMAVWCIHRLWIKWHPHKLTVSVVWTMAAIVLLGTFILAVNKDNLFYLKRPYDMKILDTGFRFIWQNTPHPAN